MVKGGKEVRDGVGWGKWEVEVLGGRVEVERVMGEKRKEERE